jgi:hypothetical protein
MVQFRIVFLFVYLCLTSCSILNNTSSQNPWLNKEMILNSPHFLSQTRYISWISWSQDVDINTIEWPGEQQGCMSHASGCVPMLKEYLNDSEYWQTWHMDSNGSQYRILTMLPAGTKYHFYKIDIPDDIYNGVIVFYAIIDNGAYRFTPAYYKYDIKKPIDLQLIKQVTFH